MPDGERFWAPAQPTIRPNAGEVWLLPPTASDRPKRVAVIDYDGQLQQVTYRGGRAYSVDGPVPSWSRDAIVEACKAVRREAHSRLVDLRPTVTQFVGDDGVQVVQIDTPEGLRRFRINVNDAPVWDHDAEVPLPD